MPPGDRYLMAAATGRTHHMAMRNLSGLARFGLAGLVLGAVAVTASVLIPGEFGALLRGYGAMLLPAAAYLFAGLGLRHLLAHRDGDERTATPIMISTRDGSLRP